MLLIAGIIWLLFKRSYNIREKLVLSEKEKRQLIEEWEPQPLVPEKWTPPAKVMERYNRGSVGVLGKYVQFEDEATGLTGPPHLNVATLNFLDFIGDKDVNAVAIQALRKYGLGSCGPRGFYGTFDVHLHLEATLESFLKVEEVAVYSYGFSTIASAIPAYSKRNDIIFADEGVSQAVHEGLTASRSVVKFFRHNDMQHLEELLIEQAKEDAKDPKKAKQTRRFFAVEGLYLDYGDICPLPRLIELKYEHKVRIIMDESISFGVLGRTGRGVTEYFNVPIEQIDILTGSLETALGLCGGFCAGTHFVVDHQRLSGQGYCFSASLPPLLAAAAEDAVERLQSEEGSRQRRLRALSRLLHSKLKATTEKVARYWSVEGDPDSPVKHIRLLNENTLDRLEEAVDLASTLPPRFIVAPEAKGSAAIPNTLNTPVLLTVARYVFLDFPCAGVSRAKPTAFSTLVGENTVIQ
ncbi:unnamed protein product [Schistocephalus solidus]|uniref:Serine palmitoyltransferase 1 n=1 Tax=Schistocephalus solidus TaxID=70667 RepID=A0A3P7BUD8_SCHSO|nr:unnamed protein product [Schistocephalus solidus]